MDLVALFESWWTNTEGQTGSDGVFEERVFGGKHVITISYKGKTETRTVHVAEQDTKYIEVTLDVEASDDDDAGDDDRIANDDEEDNERGCGC